MGVPTSEKFISNYLSEAGYVCGAFGKWHLGATDEYHPYRRGFDQFVGFRSGGRKLLSLSEMKKSPLPMRVWKTDLNTDSLISRNRISI